MPSIIPRAVVAVLAAVALALPACSDPVDPLDLDVSNAVDDFQFRAASLTGATVTREYTWQNTGVRADVTQETGLTGGSATLQLFDAAGTQVYSQSLAANGTFETSAGTAGAWRVRVVLSGASGTITFRARKHP